MQKQHSGVSVCSKDVCRKVIPVTTGPAKSDVIVKKKGMMLQRIHYHAV